MQKSIGAFFRNWRLKGGLDPEVVAGYLELSSSAVLLDYESGKRTIPLYHCYALANCLNVPPEDLFALLHPVEAKAPRK